jgi:hypothetical protein
LWDDAGDLDFKGDTWKENVVHQTNHANGLPTPEAIRLRDKGLRAVVKCPEEMGGRGKIGPGEVEDVASAAGSSVINHEYSPRFIKCHGQGGAFGGRSSCRKDYITQKI